LTNDNQISELSNQAQNRTNYALLLAQNLAKEKVGLQIWDMFVDRWRLWVS